MRAVVVVACFLPFVYYAVRDQQFHLKGRKVSFLENLLHLAIGLAIVGMFSGVLTQRVAHFLVALALFLFMGALDEYVYHRGIPGEESDLHAKEHLALFAWVGISMIWDWLAGRSWDLGAALQELRG